LIRKLFVKPNPRCLLEKAKELEAVNAVKLREKDGYVLATYAKRLVTWKQFEQYCYVPALYRSTVLRDDGSEFWPSMTKVPNFGELSEEERARVRPIVAYRKVDGSLIAVSYDPEREKLLIRTKSSWDNPFIEYFSKFVKQYGLTDALISHAERLNRVGRGTLHFELVCALPREQEGLLRRYVPKFSPVPEDERIIETPHSALSTNELDHICKVSAKLGTLRAYLLMGKTVEPSGVVLYGPEEFDWPFKPWRVSVQSFENLASVVNEKQDEEGVMVWVEGFEPIPACNYPIDPILKMKNSQYVMLTSSKGTLFSLLRYAQEGGVDDLLSLGEEGRLIVELMEKLNRVKRLMKEYRIRARRGECQVPNKGLLRQLVEVEGDEKAIREVLGRIMRNVPYSKIGKVVRKYIKSLDDVERKIKKVCGASFDL